MSNEGWFCFIFELVMVLFAIVGSAVAGPVVLVTIPFCLFFAYRIWRIGHDV